MKDTSLHEIEPAALNQFEAARKLGEMVADNAISLENAQSTMEFVFAAASKALPHHDPSGLRARLVWHMRDHSNRHWLARIRRERAQEKTLADIAEAAFRARVQEPEIRQRLGCVNSPICRASLYRFWGIHNAYLICAIRLYFFAHPF